MKASAGARLIRSTAVPKGRMLSVQTRFFYHRPSGEGKRIFEKIETAMVTGRNEYGERKTETYASRKYL
jgi:hypothetical protein